MNAESTGPGGARDVIAVVFPDPPPVEVTRVIDFAGLSVVPVASDLDVLNLPDSAAGGRHFDIAVVCLDEFPEAGRLVMETLRRSGSRPYTLVLCRGHQLHLLEGIDDLFDDFCISPFHPAEAEARLRHGVAVALARTGAPAPGEPTTADDQHLIYDDVALNLDTYQARVQGRSLDLTYMEYELLRYLVANPGKVFSREVLLSQVWGYDYFGGARTVDVHIRRLRAKLGEEHAGLIQTVRSVGYRFGDGGWRPEN